MDKSEGGSVRLLTSHDEFDNARRRTVCLSYKILVYTADEQKESHRLSFIIGDRCRLAKAFVQAKRDTANLGVRKTYCAADVFLTDARVRTIQGVIYISDVAVKVGFQSDRVFS